MGEPWVPPCFSCRLTFSDELLDPVDDVFDVELGRVDLDRVLRRHHPLGVAMVPYAKVGREGVGADLRALGEPAAGADLPVSVQIDLYVGARADDRADVTALDHGITAFRELALTRAHDGSHLGMSRDHGHDAIDPGLADRGGNVRVVDPDAALAKRDRILLSKRPELLARAEVDVTHHRQPGQSSVHRAGIEVAVAKALSEPLGDRAFSRSGGPVNGNDHRCVTDSRSSKNPGKLTATASASSISTPSFETAPATAPSIATLWSPLEAIAPPRGRAGTPRIRKPSSPAEMRTPSARSEFVTVSMRSVSLTRNSCAPLTTLTPRA